MTRLSGFILRYKRLVAVFWLGLSVVLAGKATPGVALLNTDRRAPDSLVDPTGRRRASDATYSKTRSTTSACSSAPARKYRPAVSTEAWPSRACTCAGSAPPCRSRVA
jgi:hypothetical protein